MDAAQPAPRWLSLVDASRNREHPPRKRNGRNLPRKVAGSKPARGSTVQVRIAFLHLLPPLTTLLSCPQLLRFAYILVSLNTSEEWILPVANGVYWLSICRQPAQICLSGYSPL